MLGDELTTLRETDRTVKKRQERRWDKGASSRVWVTSRINAGRTGTRRKAGFVTIALVCEKD